MTMSKGHIQDIYVFKGIEYQTLTYTRYNFLLELNGEYKLKELIHRIDFDSLIVEKYPLIISINHFFQKIKTIQSREYIINKFNKFIINLIYNDILNMSQELINRIEIMFTLPYCNVTRIHIFLFSNEERIFVGGENFSCIEITDTNIYNMFK